MVEPPEFEPAVERAIRQAAERGEFDDLPGAGKPLPGAGSRDDALWWVRGWMERQRRIDALHEADARLEQLLGRVWTIATEPEVRARVREINAALPEEVLPLDVDEVLSTWRVMAGARRLRLP
jgi:hypothetical protein